MCGGHSKRLSSSSRCFVRALLIFEIPPRRRKKRGIDRFDSIRFKKGCLKLKRRLACTPSFEKVDFRIGTSVVFAGRGGWEDREEESRRPRRRGRRDDAASTTPNRRRRRHLSKKEKGGSAFVSCTRNRTKTNTRRREVQHREETTTTKTAASNCSRTCRTPGEEDRPRHRRLALDLHF